MFVQEGPLPDSGKILPRLQGKFYPCNLRQCSSMGNAKKDHVAEALAAFSEAAGVLMKLRGIKSHSELARLVDKKSVGDAARKTINNVLSGRHDTQISKLQAIAEALDCPLWVFFLPGKSESDLASPARERLIAMVQNYLKCDTEGRHHVESMASAFAARANK